MDEGAFRGDTIGYINFAPFLIRTTVIDAHQLEFAITGVDHANYGAKGKIGVCRGEGFRVEALAIGGFAAIEPRALPTGISPPRLFRLLRLISMRYQRGFPPPVDQENQKNT